jgi:Protein of unknown function (DUF2752)
MTADATWTAAGTAGLDVGGAAGAAGSGAAAGRRLAAPAAVAVLAAGATSLLAAVDPNQAGHYPTCPFLFVTGLYCPGCGSLRALHAVAHLDVLTALDRNPLTVLALPFLLLAWAGWTRRCLTGRPRAGMLPGWAIWALLGLVLAFWVLRNLPGAGWLAP